MNEPVIECAHLARQFGRGNLQVNVFEDINLTVAPGEQVAIIGRSGCGKSTLLHLLGGLDKPSSGSVKVCGVDLATLSEAKRAKHRNKTLGFIYQFHHLLPEFTALENVAIPLLIRGESTKDASRAATDILDKVGLSNRRKHKLAELSGGERQRVAIARALVMRPACVLADEPTGNLDTETANLVYELMCSLNRELNTSFVLVTHDKSLAVKMDRIVELANGKIQA